MSDKSSLPRVDLSVPRAGAVAQPPGSGGQFNTVQSAESAGVSVRRRGGGRGAPFDVLMTYLAFHAFCIDLVY